MYVCKIKRVKQTVVERYQQLLHWVKPSWWDFIMGKIAITLPDKPKEQLVQLMALQTKNKRNKSMQVTDRERV